MNRKEIKELNSKLTNLEGLEELFEDITNKGYNHWWKISTPDTCVNLYCDSTRKRFKEFLENEIKLLKEEIKIDD